MFVFSMGGLKQNVKSVLTPVSGTVCHALLNGSLHFVTSSRGHYQIKFARFVSIGCFLKNIPCKNLFFNEEHQK